MMNYLIYRPRVLLNQRNRSDRWLLHTCKFIYKVSIDRTISVFNGNRPTERIGSNILSLRIERSGTHLVNSWWNQRQICSCRGGMKIGIWIGIRICLIKIALFSRHFHFEIERIVKITRILAISQRLSCLKGWFHRDNFDSWWVLAFSLIITYHPHIWMLNILLLLKGGHLLKSWRDWKQFFVLLLFFLWRSITFKIFKFKMRLPLNK